jgi:hypothetical protein
MAAYYSGLCEGTLHNYESAGLLRVANIIQPGATRGRKVIDREHLDKFIESYIGTLTTTEICSCKPSRVSH